ncbi:MAG TPA: hypothetical protein VGN94_06205 [Methylobacterium sp.]|jgi:hypothetical protein|nr:hypothetical protein [Methylobacterium sp.]
MRKLEKPPRIDLAFQARTDRSIALTQLAVQSSRARIEASLKLLVRVDLRKGNGLRAADPTETPPTA